MLDSAAPSSVSRRRFLQVAAAGAAGLSLLLEACQSTPSASSTGSSSAASASASSGAVKPPTYVPFQGPKADYPGSADGKVLPGYLTYPKDLVKSVPQPFGDGGDVNAMMYTTQAAPRPVDQNAAWQQVNKEMGVNMKFPLIQLADYNTKLATTLASGNLPDLLSLGSATGSNVPNLPDFLQAQCQDLTPYLSGDAIKAFPNLAALPPYAWRSSVFNNKLYAIPSVRTAITGSAMFGKGKILQQVGGPTFSSADDFLAKMKQLTVPNQQYGLGVTSGQSNGIPTIAGWFAESFGAPNVWRESGGKLTRNWETDEFKAAIQFCKQLWDAGVVSPDAPTASVNQAGQGFYAQKHILWANGFVIGDTVWNRANAQDPQFGMRALVPFSPDGGKTKPVHFLGSGAFILTVLKKADDARVKTLLNVMNYLSSPFGTKELLLLVYGAEGKDFTFNSDGNPVVTQDGGPDLFIPWPDLGAPPSVIYDAADANYARVIWKDQSDIQSIGIADPTVGLYSKTDASKAATLNQAMGDGLNNIIFGRNDMTAYDQLVKDWKANGGDQIRSEYEQALAAAKQ